MIVVDYNNESIVKFYCGECNFHGECDIKNMLSDNCVVDVDVICDICGDSYTLYVLKCKDEERAKELSAKLEFLKYKRAAEDGEDGYKGAGEGRFE
jgi:hypothetical protein